MCTESNSAKFIIIATNTTDQETDLLHSCTYIMIQNVLSTCIYCVCVCMCLCVYVCLLGIYIYICLLRSSNTEPLVVKELQAVHVSMFNILLIFCNALNKDRLQCNLTYTTPSGLNRLITNVGNYHKHQ